MTLDKCDEEKCCCFGVSPRRGVLAETAWAAAKASMLLLAEPPLSEPRKSRGWDLMAVFRSCKASWRWSDRISGEQWRRFLMLLASSISTFETSPAKRLQGSLNRARTDLGVCHNQRHQILVSQILVLSKLIYYVIKKRDTSD